jgi:hypothetical protein
MAYGVRFVSDKGKSRMDERENSQNIALNGSTGFLTSQFYGIMVLWFGA